jgi:hypothetical protein
MKFFTFRLSLLFSIICFGPTVHLNCVQRPLETKKPSLEKEKIVKDTVKHYIKRLQNKDAYQKCIANGETPWCHDGARFKGF